MPKHHLGLRSAKVVGTHLSFKFEKKLFTLKTIVNVFGIRDLARQSLHVVMSRSGFGCAVHQRQTTTR